MDSGPGSLESEPIAEVNTYLPTSGNALAPYVSSSKVRTANRPTAKAGLRKRKPRANP